MKFVIDDKIPYIREAIASMGVEAVYLDGSSITNADVKDADALIVRTRTRCNRALLKGSKVKFVATATIGYDHLDLDYLDWKNIQWCNCPGCNSGAVSQYVRNCLLLIQQDMQMDLKKTTLGVVGCGSVGSKVIYEARMLGMNVIVSDPPMGGVYRHSLKELGEQADIITFHVPLNEDFLYPTKYMANEYFFNRLKRKPIIINTSRGAVVDNEALLEALETGKVRQAVIDTWENEPYILKPLLQKVYIGTPHIAGYSAEGKTNANNMLLEELCLFFNLPFPKFIAPPPLPNDFVYTGNPLELYNPKTDSEKLKKNPELFEYFRGHYPVRRERVWPYEDRYEELINMEKQP